MGKMIKGVALALAGLGLLAGTASKDDARSLHQQIRTRVLERVGVGGHEMATGDLRAALRADPDFDRLLAYHLQRLLNAGRTSHLAEDAVQTTLYKVWKGRPEIFLREHDEVERYLRVAMSRNLVSERKRAAVQHGLGEGVVNDLADHTAADPSAATAAQEAFDELYARCAPEDQPVLREQLAGAQSARAVAKRIGMTRFAAGRSSKRLAEKLEHLLS